MTAGVIQLESPNAVVTIDLGRDAQLTQSVVNNHLIEPLPQGLTLFVPEVDEMVRTWTIQGYLDPDNYHLLRKQLDDAAQDWNITGDGRARLIWGEETEGGADYDFDVAIVSITYSFLAKEGGTETQKYLEFTISLIEAPPTDQRLGNLNA